MAILFFLFRLLRSLALRMDENVFLSLIFNKT